MYDTLLNNRVTGQWGKIKINTRLVRNFRKSSVPIGKKGPHLRKGKATEYLASGFDNPGQSPMCHR